MGRLANSNRKQPQPQGSAPARLIIDTDTAGDDCIAILTCLRAEQVTVEAITINCGNVKFDQQVENALATLEVAGAPGRIPVYPGCQRPLLKDWTTVEHIHGPDGMGGSNLPRARQRPETTHAVDAIIDLVLSNPGEISVLAIAPLTNLALALTREPRVAQAVKQCWIMGGCRNALGNVTPAAEFNFWVDPDAARIVFRSGLPITMVGWEIATRHSVVSAEERERIAGLGTTEAQFFLDVTRTNLEFATARQGLAGTTHPDTIVAAMIVDPAVIAEAHQRYVEIETCSPLTRGASPVDEFNTTGNVANARVVYQADEARFKKLLFNTLRAR